MNVVKHVPVTLGAVALLWVLRATYGFNTVVLRDTLGFGVDARSPWWTWATSALTVGTWFGAVLSTIALLSIGGFVERKLGSRQFLAAAVMAHVIGLAVGALVAWGLDAVGWYWGEQLANERVLNPFVWLCGVSMYASAQMGPLWRRRTRAMFFALTISLILYAGVMSDFAFFAAALGGWVAGLVRIQEGVKKPVASIRESRVLMAIVVMSVFLGPVFSGLNPDATGPFSGVAFFTLPQMTSEQAEILCLDGSSDPACVHAMWQLRSSGIGPLLANLMPLVVVATLAAGLVRGRRIAHRFILLCLVAATAAIAFELVQFEMFNVPMLVYIALPFLLTMIILLLCRDLFQVRLSPARRRRFYTRLGLWWLATAAVWVLCGRLAFSGPWSQILLATPLRYLPPQLSKFFLFDVLPFNTVAWILTEWTGIIFWVGFIVMFWRLLEDAPDPCIAADRDRARTFLESSTGDHLSWMTLWTGNRYWFGDTGFVAYRMHNGIAVTVGEPVGTNRTELADAFERHIYAQGAHVSWYSVRQSFAATRAHWNALPVASESVIDVAEEPAFKGKKFQDIRTARNRAAKEGITCEWTTWSESSFAVRNQITAISEEWISDKALPEMGFTLGGLAELDDPSVRLMLAVSEDGTVHGVTSWLPSYEDGIQTGWILDFMRRSHDGFKPVVEYLIAETLLRAHADGIKWVSLSGAPLAVEGVGMLGQALERVGAALEPLYGFRSLAAFKRKFDPSHETWLMLYRDELTLPAIGMAVSKCYVPNLAPMSFVFGPQSPLRAAKPSQPK